MMEFFKILFIAIMFGLFNLGVFATIIWFLRIFDDKGYPE